MAKLEPKDEDGGFGTKFGAAVGPFLTSGLQLAISVVAFFFLGRWLDDKFGTTPWLMIAGLVLGIVGGFTSFFRTAIAAGKEEDKEAAEERKRAEREHRS
jgi:F0F1-type ATP synthase assembly protein I